VKRPSLSDNHGSTEQGNTSCECCRRARALRPNLPANARIPRRLRKPHIGMFGQLVYKCAQKRRKHGARGTLTYSDGLGFINPSWTARLSLTMYVFRIFSSSILRKMSTCAASKRRHSHEARRSLIFHARVQQNATPPAMRPAHRTIDPNSLGRGFQLLRARRADRVRMWAECRACRQNERHYDAAQAEAEEHRGEG
jgi:hypothetical protein